MTTELAVDEICVKEFGERPFEVKRKFTGICNEVFEIKLSTGIYILRLSTIKRNITGTSRFLPLIKSLNIPTFDIIVANYKMTNVPYYYQIISKISGDDLELVMQRLSRKKIKQLASEISTLVDKFKNILTPNQFGVVSGEDEESFASQLEMIMTTKVILVERNKKTGVISPDIWTIYDQLIDRYSSYLLSVQPTLYFEDMISKNVMIDSGRFIGLIDLDFLKCGDFLEFYGKIFACWWNIPQGKYYVEEIFRLKKFSGLQLDVIKMYAIFTLTDWLSEVGIKFNDNTSENIDDINVAESKAQIYLLKAELDKNISTIFT